MKRLLYFFLLLPLVAVGQQLPDKSPFTETGFIWNPAMTAPFRYWEIEAGYRQQWLGFEDAPRTATISIQYPFVREGMSLGGFFLHDRVGPVKFSALSVSYAYKFPLGISERDQLSLGIMLTGNQFFLDALGVVVNDPDDVLLPDGESDGFNTNAGFGIFYTSYARNDYSRNYVFAGMAVNQIFPVNLIFEQSGSLANLKRAFHGNALFGARFNNDGFYIEPSAWINFAGQNISSANFNVRFEKTDAFWGGLTYSSNQTLALQVGYIVSKGLIQNSSMRIGTLGSFNMSSFGRFRGLGYEFFVGYRFEL